MGETNGEHRDDLHEDEEGALKPVSIRRRSAARFAALQTLYQCWASGCSPVEAVPLFRSSYLPRLLEDFGLERMNEGHYTGLVFGVEGRRDVLDAMIVPYLKEGWPLERLNQIERDILRAALYELLEVRDISARTIIAEYSAIADSWNIEAGHITAILDRLAHQSRADEFSA